MTTWWNWAAVAERDAQHDVGVVAFRLAKLLLAPNHAATCLLHAEGARCSQAVGGHLRQNRIRPATLPLPVDDAPLIA